MKVFSRLLSVMLIISMIMVSNFSLYCSAEELSGFSDEEISFSKMDDPALLEYVEHNVYSQLVNELDSDEFFVENVSTVYISKEYTEELTYNSQANVYFGYTLNELDAQFQGTKYIFTLGEDGQTVVHEMQIIDDEYLNQVIRNVAIGTGVILVCVTVSVVTAGAGAPAVSMIFAASAKTGTVFALSSGAISGAAAGIVKTYQTGDVSEGLKAAAIEGSEAFKWGAVIGAVTGGAGETIALKGATCNGLTMNQAAAIQKESGYPLDVIKGFKTPEQYEIVKEAGLVPKVINGKTALVRSIDLDFVDDMGRTNLQRMQKGLAAVDPATGTPYELHHIGQEMDSTLAILTKAEHMQGGNNTIWHELGSDVSSKIDRAAFDVQRSEFWKTMAVKLSGIA